MTLSLDTAYRSFGGEVEASSTPTICRLPDSRRHQLWAIALQLPYKERALYDGSGTTMTMNQSRSAALSRRRVGRSPPAEGRSKNRQSVRTNYERYLALARAQTLAGDQVEAENSYQHAEHYFRSMSESAR